MLFFCFIIDKMAVDYDTNYKAAEVKRDSKKVEIRRAEIMSAALQLVT